MTSFITLVAFLLSILFPQNAAFFGQNFSSGGTPTFIQEGSVFTNTATGSSVVFSPGKSITAGHYGLISMYIDATTTHVTSIITSGGDNGTEVDSTNHCTTNPNTNTAAICPWYVKFNTGGTLTFTVNFSLSVSSENLFFVVDEVSNLHGTTDGFHFANPSGSTSVSSGSFTTATAHDFLWGAFSTFPDCSSPLTAGAGFTLTAANGDTTALVYKADSGSAGSQSVSVNSTCTTTQSNAVGVAFTPGP